MFTAVVILIAALNLAADGAASVEIPTSADSAFFPPATSMDGLVGVNKHISQPNNTQRVASSGAHSTADAATSCSDGSHTAQNLNTYVLSAGNFSLTASGTGERSFLLRIPLSAVSPYMPYFINDKAQGLQQGLLDAHGFLSDWAATAAAVDRERSELHARAGLAVLSQCSSHLEGPPSVHDLLARGARCALKSAPTNAMLALHGKTKASIIVDVDHVSLTDIEALLEVSWVPDPQLVGEVHGSCHPHQPLDPAHHDRHYHHFGTCGYAVQPGKSSLSVILSGGKEGMSMFFKIGSFCNSGGNDCLTDKCKYTDTSCLQIGEFTCIQGSDKPQGTACMEGAVAGECDGSGVCVQSVANDPLITGFDGKSFHYNEVGNRTLLEDGEGRKILVTFSGTTVAEGQEEPQEKSWTTAVTLVSPNGDAVFCSLPGILPNTSLVTMTTTPGATNEVNPTPTPILAAAPTLQMEQMSAEAVLSWKEYAGVQYSSVVGCKVTTPKYVVTVYQVSGWEEAQARPVEHGWAAPYTWLNLNVQMTGHLVAPVTGILGDTYPKEESSGQQSSLSGASTSTDPSVEGEGGEPSKLGAHRKMKGQGASSPATFPIVSIRMGRGI